MRLEYTEEQERELRITEIYAILENDLYEDDKEESDLISELEELEAQSKGEANMEKKKYYAITTSMTFEKTVLVPVDSVNDIEEAIRIVDDAVEICSIDLLNEEAECKTKASRYADENGMYNLPDDEAELYQIVRG